MRKGLMACVSVVGLALGFGLTGAQAQEHPAGHEHEQVQSQVAAAAEPDEIFCPTMKTGQLCSHGSADTLGLEGVKREAWVAAARRYNRAVDEATKHLLSDADSLLTPQERAEVERWFQKGLNPQINQLLDAAKASK